ncbi:MAG TPA: AAA family ATPase [Candidatus Bathyarchaeia archaeon]|nr:AAA family ATPase [Candidatus Bathyarchaeia archaeon]
MVDAVVSGHAYLARETQLSPQLRAQALVETEPALVDREDELAFLKELLDQTLAGKGQVVFVGGEAGVEKTRLIHELGQHARSRDAIFAVGPSYEEESSIPYSPWTEAIRSIVQQRRNKTFDKALGRTLAEVGRLVPELESRATELGIKGWLSGPRESFMPSPPTDAERVRLFQAITDLLVNVSQERPLVISLDDVLWADGASLQLLHYLARRMRDQRILVAATYRDTELPEEHQLSRLIFELNRERSLKRIHLNRLTAKHIAELISNQLGGGTVDHDFAKLVYSRTGGNPFFVEEVIRSLSEAEGIARSAEGWGIRETQDVEIPSTIRAIIKQRISRLGEDTTQTLMLCAAIGMEFEYEILSRVAGSNEEQLIKQLEAATQAGLVRETHSGKKISYFFADEQIREFLYDELSLIRKRKTHAKLAHAIEEYHVKEPELHFEELAYHYIQAGESAKAAEFSRLAGDRAAALHAHTDAKNHFRNVMELLEPGQILERVETVTKIADVSNRIGERVESIKFYREAISLAENLKDDRKMAQLYLKLGYAYYVAADNATALETLRQGLMFLRGMPDTHEEAAISQNIARLLLNSGEVEEGLQWCEKAIKLAKQLNDQEVLAHALISRSYGLRASRSTKTESAQLLENALEIATKNGFDEPACRAFLNMGGFTARVKARYPKGVEIFKQGIDYSKKTGQLTYEAWIEAELAFLALIPLGELDLATEAANHAHRIGSEISDWFTSYSILPLGIVQLWRGNLRKAEEYLADGLVKAEKAGNSLVLYQYHWALGELQLKKDDPVAAKQHLLKATALGPGGVWTYPPLEAYFGLLKVSLMQQERKEARAFLDKIKEEANELDEPWGYAYDLWGTGLMAESEGEHSNARDALKASNRIWNELKHRYNYAQTLLDCGRVMIERLEEKERATTIEEGQRIMANL